ncbi:hypothetical protein [Streptomyces cucumeris]|uniref:hypothetical protein n=1 Tax=Streptomyces cucumeris TaxID=2962890 RepID=UPI003D752740
MSVPSLVRRRTARPATPLGRRPRHPVFAEVRGGSARWVALAVCVVEALTMAAKADFWQGSWAETRYQLHIGAAMLCGPLVAAAGCWQGAREHRSRMTGLRASASRSEFTQFLVVSLPVALAVVVAHTVIAALSFLATWPYVSGGRPIFVPVAADLTVLVSATVIGAVVGRLVPWRLTAPALALAVYLLLGFTDDASPVRFLSPAADNGFGDQGPVWWQPLTMIVWTGGLAAAVVCAHTFRPRWSWCAVVPLAAAAIAAAVPMVRVGEGMWPAHTRTEVCDNTTTPRVCVDAEYKGLLPQVSAALSGMTGRLKGVHPLPDRLPLPPFFVGQNVVRGELADPERFVWETGAALVRECDDGPDAYLHYAVQDWLVSNDLAESRRKADEEQARDWGDRRGLAESRATAHALSRLTSMGEDRRRVWLNRYFAAGPSCDFSKVPAL